MQEHAEKLSSLPNYHIPAMHHFKQVAQTAWKAMGGLPIAHRAGALVEGLMRQPWLMLLG
jgi:hypothetical protein